MEALYYHGVKRTKVCSLHFRREDSRNYLNGRIPERWFCLKFALSGLLPRKGKHSSWPALSSFCYLRAEMHGNWCVATQQSLGVLIDRAYFCAWTVYNEAECLHSLHDPVFKNFEQCHKSSNFWKTRNPSTSCWNRSRARANTMFEYLHALSLPEPSSFFLLS